MEFAVEKEDRNTTPLVVGLTGGGPERVGAVRFSSKTILATNGEICPLPIAAILNPFENILPTPPNVSRPLARCSFCVAVCNPFCGTRETDQRDWRCGFCGKWNRSKAFGTNNLKPRTQTIDRDPRYHEPLELGFDVVETFVSPEASAMNRSVSSARAVLGKRPAACIFVIDTNICSSDLCNFSNSLEQVLSQLPHDAYVGLITIGQCVNVYEVSARYNSAISADSFNCYTELTPSDVDSFLKRDEDHCGEFMSPVHYCKDHIVAIVQNLPGVSVPRPMSRKEERTVRRKQRKAAKEIVDDRETIVSSERSRSQKKLSTRHDESLRKTEKTPIRLRVVNETAVGAKLGSSKNRCIGTGVVFALGILRAAQEASGSIIVCTNGEANAGKTTLRNFETIGECALKQNVVVHIMCIGSVPFNTPLLRKLSQANGGSVTIYRTFGCTLEQNILQALTRFSSARIGLTGKGTKNIRTNVSVRSTYGVELAHVIGPSNLVISEQAMPAPAIETGSAVHDFSMVMADANSAITFYFNASKVGSLDRCTYIQFIVTATDEAGGSVSRVITRRLVTTSSKEAYLKSVDIGVTTVAIGKKAVRMASNLQNPALASEDICNRMYNTIGFFRRCCERKQELFPGCLEAIPKQLFNLLRGPCIGSIIQHEDDIECVRDMYLKASFEDCIRLTSPQLMCLSRHKLIQAGRPPAVDPKLLETLLVRVPLETLALQSNSILILDHHTDILIWSGAEMKGIEYDVVRTTCIQMVEQWCVGRYPYPNIMQFSEGDSMARFLEARLVPSHKDSEFQQLKSFPILAQLDKYQLKELREKLVWTDDYSYCEWMAQVTRGERAGGE